MEKFISHIKVREQAHIVLRDRYGRIKVDRWVKNSMGNLGTYHIAGELATNSYCADMDWMAIGTGTATQFELGVELDRNALTSQTHTNNVVTYVGDWAAGDGTGAITEAGIFSQATLGGVELVYASFSAINKLAADTLKITWTLTFN